MTEAPNAQHIWPIWILRVLGVAVAVDVLLMALAGSIENQDSSCNSSGSWLSGLLALIWIFGPPAALIWAALRDERRGHVRGAEGYAMGALAIIVLTHFMVIGFMITAGPSCGLF
jgi:hypothetical protein